MLLLISVFHFLHSAIDIHVSCSCMFVSPVGAVVSKPCLFYSPPGGAGIHPVTVQRQMLGDVESADACWVQGAGAEGTTTHSLPGHSPSGACVPCVLDSIPCV